jgi:hypothetical protein
MFLKLQKSFVDFKGIVTQCPAYGAGSVVGVEAITR